MYWQRLQPSKSQVHGERLSTTKTPGDGDGEVGVFCGTMTAGLNVWMCEGVGGSVSLGSWHMSVKGHEGQ